MYFKNIVENMKTNYNYLHIELQKKEVLEIPYLKNLCIMPLPQFNFKNVHPLATTFYMGCGFVS